MTIRFIARVNTEEIFIINFSFSEVLKIYYETRETGSDPRDA
jgi:hypothetical protein